MAISPDQIRAARALLKWSQNDLADRSGVSLPAIANIEVEKQQASASTKMKLAAAIEAAGVELIDGGVRRTKNTVRVLQGHDANNRLLEDIYNTLQGTGGEVLISGLREVSDLRSKAYQDVLAHIQRLQGANITERILVEEGDKNFVAPKEWYRWLPKAYFSPHTFQLYGDKLAMINWGPPQEVVVIHSPFFAESFRNFFNFSWDNARKPTVK